MKHLFFSESHRPDINRAIGDFVSRELLGMPGRFDKFCSMGVFLDDELICGVLYHNYMPEFGTVEMSAAALSRRWMSKAVLRDMLNMPFDALGCHAIIACHDEAATHLRRMWTSVGGVETVVANKRGAGRAEVVSVLTADKWHESRYMKDKEMAHGQ